MVLFLFSCLYLILSKMIVLRNMTPIIKSIERYNNIDSFAFTIDAIVGLLLREKNCLL